MKRYRATICWISKQKGGRSTIPSGDKYAPIIKVCKIEPNTSDFWSIFVVNEKIISKSKTIATLKYLSDFAPDNLCEGDKFELYEGPNLVATGTITHQL